jgi:hypothetical protein
MSCHNQIWNDSPMIEPIRRSYYSGKPIPWNKVHDMPDFVYFNHSAHVNKGVGCESCHGRVDDMAAVHQDTPMNMAWCLSCHREPEKNIRPKDKVTLMGWESDLDGDGLPNTKEDVNGNGQLDEGETDPKNPDTDGDGAYDGHEVKNHTAPTEKGSRPKDSGPKPRPESCAPFDSEKPEDTEACANEYKVRRLTNCTTCHR